jgi:hypothetical protein
MDWLVGPKQCGVLHTLIQLSHTTAPFDAHVALRYTTGRLSAAIRPCIHPSIGRAEPSAMRCSLERVALLVQQCIASSHSRYSDALPCGRKYCSRRH